MCPMETALVVALVDRMNDPLTRVDLERLSTRSLAQRVGLKETDFRRVFRSITGKSPQRYLVERRMEQAARMLAEGDEMVKNIARAVGYSDPYHFSHAFKATMGVSPTRHRSMSRTHRDGR